jgi:hypothetical protein
MKLNLLIAVICISTTAHAQNYQYPELAVSPRASERLKIEYKTDTSRWATNLPVQLSAISTLAAGLSSSSIKEDKKDKSAYTTATAIGAAWLGVSLWVQYYYNPYYNGLKRIQKIPNKTPREQLIYERLAEETIHEAASLAKKIKWLSFTTNLGANVWVFSDSKTGSTGKNMAIVGIVSSFAPLLFPYKWESVSEDQKNYKKKIFGPISMNTTVMQAPGSFNEFVPGLMLNSSF